MKLLLEDISLWLVELNYFRNCIDSCELIDIGAIGSNFTWQRFLHGIPTIWKKIDRVMAD